MRIVQCWDDGVVDDVRLIEILRRHGAKASFNLNLGTQPAERQAVWVYRGVKEVWKLGKGELREVYAGFTIANHSATHPKLQEIPPERAAEDIRRGRELLEQHFGCAVTGFAYPFGTHSAAVREAVCAAGHVYARTTQAVDCAFPPADAMAFNPNCHVAVADFWERVERVRGQPDGVFYFWGHSYELISEADWQAMAEKIARLSAYPDAVWCDLPALFAPPGNAA
jgi:peptidoglycan/xylan/chitin deacetylase (PgdA/CDA1 family)